MHARWLPARTAADARAHCLQPWAGPEWTADRIFIWLMHLPQGLSCSLGQTGGLGSLGFLFCLSILLSSWGSASFRCRHRLPRAPQSPRRRMLQWKRPPGACEPGLAHAASQSCAGTQLWRPDQHQVPPGAVQQPWQACRRLLLARACVLGLPGSHCCGLLPARTAQLTLHVGSWEAAVAEHAAGGRFGTCPY